MEWCSISIFRYRSRNVGSGTGFHESTGESESVIFFIAWGVLHCYLLHCVGCSSLLSSSLRGVFFTVIFFIAWGVLHCYLLHCVGCSSLLSSSLPVFVLCVKVD